MNEENKSSKIRNYSIAGFFVLAAAVPAFLFLQFMVLGFGGTEVNTWSECNADSANVFVGANENLENVKCVALDKEFFAEQEKVIGDMKKNDEDVCRFNLTTATLKPLRFEIQYNNTVRREVCSWQNFSGGMD
jgi:hypothetical protein